MLIREDALQGPEIAGLLQRHLDLMISQSPPGSVHALDLEALRVPEITFWTGWEGDALLGCGALKQLDPAHGEIKSMHTAQEYRGKGVARQLLRHIIAEAKQRAYARLSLETGSTDVFEAARTMYAGFGFEMTAPFGDYREDPHSAFMTLDLRAALSV